MDAATVGRFLGRSAGKRGPYKRMGLHRLGDGWPKRVSIRQRVLEEVPEKCPECGAEEQIFQDRQVPRRVFCWVCQHDWWMVRPGNGNGNGAR